MDKVDLAKFCCAARVLTHGYSWPQKNYKCSFCKKEFKSAQALGGHMNVHRRDRAKMRLSSSPASRDHGRHKQQNPKPNNSNPTAPSSSSHMSRFLSSVTFPFSSPSLASIDKEKLPIVANPLRDEGAFLQLGELRGVAKRSDFRVWRKKEMVGLDFEMGLLQDAKEDVDLELRLGYS